MGNAGQPVHPAQLSALQLLIKAGAEGRTGGDHRQQRLQPLLAVIPSGSPFRSCLDQQLQRGELRWMDWLTCVPHQAVRLPAEALVNANCPADLAALEG